MNSSVLRPPIFVGLNKARTSANYCFFNPTGRTPQNQLEILLVERFSREKKSGDPLYRLAITRMPWRRGARYEYSESSWGQVPSRFEPQWQKIWPLFEELGVKGIPLHSGPHNFLVSHHEAHAWSAAYFSPFAESLIVVFDGYGHSASVLEKAGVSRKHLPKNRRNRLFENYSVFHLKGGKIRLLQKRYQRFVRNDDHYGEFREIGYGWLFGLCSKHVFGDLEAAGKLMGLAPYGSPKPFGTFDQLVGTLEWRKRNTAKLSRRSKKFSQYADIAASAQNLFERSLIDDLQRLRKRYPSIPNLILTGGCALNCVANSKIVERGIFPNIYVPPAPGDESISHGAAVRNAVRKGRYSLKPLHLEKQTSFMGLRGSAREGIESEIRSCFKGFRIRKSADPAGAAAKLLTQGHVLAVFRGRSEIGPRALGHRSILANPLKPGIRDFLNSKVKFREDFRPFGASVSEEHAHRYFEVPEKFSSPFMSFAPRVRPAFLKKLDSVMSPDGRCRIQTVSRKQDAFFHRVIREFGKKSGCHVLLHTSLNVRGEPIVESLADARAFFSSSCIRHILVGGFLIEK